MLETADEVSEKTVGKMVMAYENGLKDEKWTVARVMKATSKNCKLRDENGRCWTMPNKWVRELMISRYAEFPGDLKEYLRPIEIPPGLCEGMNAENEGRDELD